jgi:hypothetical protein
MGLRTDVIFVNSLGLSREGAQATARVLDLAYERQNPGVDLRVQLIYRRERQEPRYDDRAIPALRDRLLQNLTDGVHTCLIMDREGSHVGLHALGQIDDQGKRWRLQRYVMAVTCDSAVGIPNCLARKVVNMSTKGSDPKEREMATLEQLVRERRFGDLAGRQNAYADRYNGQLGNTSVFPSRSHISFGMPREYVEDICAELREYREQIAAEGTLAGMCNGMVGLLWSCTEAMFTQTPPRAISRDDLQAKWDGMAAQYEAQHEAGLALLGLVNPAYRVLGALRSRRD